METISIDFPAEILAALQTDPLELKRDLALTWYRQGKISQAQAAAFSGLPAESFTATPAERLDLDEFLDWASHDLKSPLNAVIGFSKVVMKGIDGPVNETQAADLASVHGNGQRMLTYISGLVDVARLNRGDIHLKTEALDITALTEEILPRWKAQNPGKEAFFLALTAPQTPMVQGEASRLRQMLSGFLTFAALHLEAEGRLTLEMEASDGGVVFSLRAVGLKAKGIPQVDTQLASFVSAGLLRLHGGRLELLQEEPDGARVRFWLPAAV